MGKLLWIFTLAVATFLVVQSNALEPIPRTTELWMDRHNEFVANTKNNSADIKIVFIGSSSIERWGTTGLSIWNSKYKPLGAVNYGIGADKIENCLWRISNGELENLNPKMIVFYCGSNNVRRNASDEIIDGVLFTLNEISRRLPNTKVLYVNFFPRRNTLWKKIPFINQQMIDLNDNPNRVVFDMFEELLESRREMKTELFESDLIHLNKDGYAVWDAAMNETFYNLWNSAN